MFSFALGLFLAVILLGLLESFRLSSKVFAGAGKVMKVLDVFEVFLGIFEKTKEKEDKVLRSFCTLLQTCVCALLCSSALFCV